MEINITLLVALFASAVLGIIGSWMAYEWTKKRASRILTAFLTVGVFLIIGIVTAGLLSPPIGQSLGFREAPTGPAPAQPAKEAYTSVTVTDALTSTTTAINNADVDVLGAAPIRGEPVAKLAENTYSTDVDGFTSMKIDGVYPGREAWLYVQKSNSDNYYPESKMVELKETRPSGAAASVALSKEGTLNWKLMNKTPSDNITVSGSTIELDATTGPWTFDLVLETSDSDTVLRDLQLDAEEGAFTNVSVEHDPSMAEGVSSSLSAGDPTFTDDDEATWKFDGDLNYLKDIRVTITIENQGAGTGTIADYTVNDLFTKDEAGGFDGVPEDIFSIDMTAID